MTLNTIAAFIASPGMCWGDDASRAQPHRFSTPVVQEAEPRVIPLLFPECSEGEGYPNYRNTARPVMREWVQAILNRVSVDTPHDLWVLATDFAVIDTQRPLGSHEAVLLTRVVKEMFDAHEAMRRHVPGKLFAR